MRALKPVPQVIDPGASADATPKPAANLRVKIMPEAQAALAELVEQTGRSPEEVLTEAILAHHRSLIAATVSPSNKRQAAESQLSQVQPSLPLFH